MQRSNKHFLVRINWVFFKETYNNNIYFWQNYSFNILIYTVNICLNFNFNTVYKIWIVHQWRRGFTIKTDEILVEFHYPASVRLQYLKVKRIVEGAFLKLKDASSRSWLFVTDYLIKINFEMLVRICSVAFEGTNVNNKNAAFHFC